MSNRDQIEIILDRYQAVVDRRVCAQIDAGACQTASDFRKSRKAQETEETTREECVAALLSLTQEGV